jgi:hypothetical protein
MLIKILLPVPGQFLDRIRENITVLSCYSKNFILTTSHQTLALFSD